MGNDMQIIAKMDTTSVGLAVLAALVHVRTEVPFSIRLEEAGVIVEIEANMVQRCVTVREVERGRSA